MKTTLVLKECKLSLLSCFLLLLSPPGHAAQFVEIDATIDATSWPAEKIETPKTHSYTVRCVVGLDTWFIEGNFYSNATAEDWWTGSNVLQRAVGTGTSAAAAPGSRTLVQRSPNGRPVRSLGFNNVPWLAFCSGPFLKTIDRHVPLPIGVPSRRLEPDYSDTTVVFDDALGLPQHMEFHTSDKQLVCRYEVHQSTNFLGWNFPLQFKILESRLGLDGTLIRHAHALGKVTSIRLGTEPRIPADTLTLTNFVFSGMPTENSFPVQLRPRNR